MQNASMTHRYIPRKEQYENNLFVEEYYASPDTFITIDDIEQTEIGYISYSVQEQLKPLYGYASRTFDDVAIGNRIVTGMFKVPIKNPMAQSSLEEIQASIGANTDDYIDYNNNQDELLKYQDWIKSDTTPDDLIFNMNENVSEWISKLIKLGYLKDYNVSDEDIKYAIQKFQRDHNKEDNGWLSSTIKDLIDKEIANMPTISINVLAGTIVYEGPSETYPEITTLTYNMKATIIDDGYDKNWKFVRFEDDTEGYIQYAS